MSDLIHLSNVRISFPHLVQKNEKQFGDGSFISEYSADFIMAPDHPDFIKLMKRINELALDKWKDKTSTVMNMINADRKSRCFGQGSERIHKTKLTVLDGYENMVFITAKNKKFAPQIIKADGSAVDPTNTLEFRELGSRIYGGCYVNAAVRPWVFAGQHGNRASCDLVAVQFLKDGEAFGAAPPDARGTFSPVGEVAVTGLPSFLQR